MDPSLIQSLTGTTQPAETKGKKADAADGDIFSKALEDATGKPNTSGKAGQSMIDDKGGDKASEKKEEKKKQARAEQEEFQKVASHQADKGTPGYLRNKLMHTNPDIMSIGERQTARVGEFSLDAQARLAQQKGVQQQPQSGAAAKLASGVPPQSTKSHSSRPSDEHKELAAARKEDREDREAFEKLAAKTKEAAGEKGPVNLEKLLNNQASKDVQGPNRAAEVERAQERQGVLNQILSQIEVRNLASKTEMQFNLSPAHLGEMKLNLTHTDEGVRADFTTTSRETRELLQEGEDDLRSQAKDRGVRLGAMRFQLVDSLT